MFNKAKEKLKEIMRSDASGTGRFSYHCKNCGFTYSSDSRQKRDAAKKNHRVPYELKDKTGKTARVLMVCPMVKTSRGTLVRKQMKGQL